MIAISTDAWREANQRYLTALLGEVRSALEKHMAGLPGDGRRSAEQGAGPAQVQSAARWDLPAPAAVDSLCDAFGLSPFERSILLLCAGVELESKVAALSATAQGAGARIAPTFSLALAALPDAHWSALTSDAPLRYWRLIDVGSGEALTTSPLRIDERILHFLTGLTCTDVRLDGIIRYEHEADDLCPTHRRKAEALARAWSTASASPGRLRVNLYGRDSAAKLSIACQVTQAIGMRLAVTRASDLPQDAAGRDVLARIWDREAILSSSALAVDSTEGDFARSVQPFIDRLHCPLFVISDDPVPPIASRHMLRVDVPRPESEEQYGLWQRALGAATASMRGLEAVSARFRLSTRAVESVSTRVLADRLPDGETELDSALWEECRVQARTSMSELAERIGPAASRDDLILPESQKRTLEQIAAHVRQSFTVYEKWGFARRSHRGLGVNALFAGASGTGKTMAAEVLANELRLDLYRIDLSQVVSKYIGETEKNLKRVFDAAEEGGSILLFDEADALFGKRSEVKDSHDRYANIEVGYLLQRMEAYRGLAILTTNLKSAIDPAFMRRLRFVIQFPFPDFPQRVEIWRRAFPPETPTSGLDATRLARLQVTGGSIRNIALHAAFLAADEGEAVTMKHVLMGARTEYAKLEKPLAEAETAGWL